MSHVVGAGFANQELRGEEKEKSPSEGEGKRMPDLNLDTGRWRGRVLPLWRTIQNTGCPLTVGSNTP